MRKAGFWLLVVSSLAVSSSLRAEELWTTQGFPEPTTVGMVAPGEPAKSGTPISGLQPSEVSRGISFRVATNELYVVGSSSRLYRLNPATGVATQVGSPFVPPLDGTEFGVGFDNSDRLRVVSNTGQNLRIDPATGVAHLDAPLAFAPGDVNAGKTPQVGAIAFDPLHGGATAYAVDDQLGLLRLGSATANDGRLTTIAAGPGPFVGFVISRDTGTAFGLAPGFSPALVTLDLTTGATHQVATVGGQFDHFAGLAQGGVLTTIPTLGWQGLVTLAFALALSALWLRRERRRAV
jgi:hypothetical protein